AYPALAARRESTRWNHAVDVGMKQQILPPRMQDAEEADLRAKMLRICSDFNEGFSYRTEQQVVQFDFILPDEIRQFVRQTEHDMEVTGGQEFPLSGGDPSLACLRLTLGTMPVPARNGEISITCLMGSISLWGVVGRKRAFCLMESTF